MNGLAFFEHAWLLPPPSLGTQGIYFAVNVRSDQEQANHGWTTHAAHDVAAWLTETLHAHAVRDPSRLRLGVGPCPSTVEAATDFLQAHPPPDSVLRHLRTTKLEVYISGHAQWSQVNAQFVDAYSDAEWAEHLDLAERRLQLAFGVATPTSRLSQLDGLTASLVNDHLWPA